MQQQAAMFGQKEMHCFDISIYNMIILKLLNAGISPICIISLVWKKSVIIYGVWKKRGEMCRSRFRSILSGIIWGLKSKFELQSGDPLQGNDFYFQNARKTLCCSISIQSARYQ
jgi:hypothetical protein